MAFNRIVQCITPSALVVIFAVSQSVFAVQLTPVAADGVTPIDNAVQHGVAMAWTETGGATGGFIDNKHALEELSHLSTQTPGSPSFASAAVCFTAEDTDGFQPANILVRPSILDPFGGAMANAETSAFLTQINIAAELHAATIAPGAPASTDADESPWRYRLDPTGAEITGEPLQIRAFASIDGTVSASADEIATSRILTEFSVNGQVFLATETIADQDTTNAIVDESVFTVFSGNLGDVVELDFFVRTDAVAVSESPRVATARVTSLRFDIEFRLIREIADLNNDGFIDSSDLAKLIMNFGEQGTNFDLNADGIINSSDIAILIGVFGMPSL